MSDIGGNPEDLFSHNEAHMIKKVLGEIITKYPHLLQLYKITHMSLVVTKPVFRAFDLVPHKPGCRAREDGQKLDISD